MRGFQYPLTSGHGTFCAKVILFLSAVSVTVCKDIWGSQQLRTGCLSILRVDLNPRVSRVNVSVKYFSKLCFGTIQIQPELKYLKPILEDFTS